MKPFKTLGSFVLSASALFLVTSCTKTIDEQSEKNDQNSEQLIGEGAIGGRCGRFIGMRLKKGDGRFWYEDIDNAQIFTGNDWTTDMSLMKVTSFANGASASVTGTQPVYVPVEENLGVLSNGDVAGTQETGRINVGEVLRMEIGNQFPGVKFYGFDLNLNASRDCEGVVKMFDGATLVAQYNFSGVGRKVKNFTATYRTIDGTFFTSMEFSTTIGGFRINGAQGSPNPLNQPDARFYVVDLPNQAFFNNDLKQPSPFPFMTSIVNGVATLPENYQLRSLLPEGQAGSGEFNLGNKEWIKLEAEATGPNVGLTYSSTKLAIRTTNQGEDNSSPIEANAINPGEILTITAGDDLPFKFFRTFEMRESHPVATGGAPLEVKLWNGATQVGGGLTSGNNKGYNAFYSTQDFDKITVEGTGAAAAIGRPSPVAIRITRGCPNPE